MLWGYLLIDNYSTNTNKHLARRKRNGAPLTTFDAGLQPARTNERSQAQHGGLPITLPDPHDFVPSFISVFII